MRHDGNLILRSALVDPVVIVAAHELAELLIRLALLVHQHLLDALVGRVGQINLPPRYLAVERAPRRERRGHLAHGGYTPELGAVVGRGLLGDELLRMHVLLDRQQDLVGIDGLDDVIGDLRPDGLVHDILLLALGHHDDGRGGPHLLDERQRLESRHTGHHLVENNEVVSGRAHHVDGVVTVVACVDLVTFSLKKQHVRLQQLDFVVDPEYFYHIFSFIFSYSANTLRIVG